VPPRDAMTKQIPKPLILLVLGGVVLLAYSSALGAGFIWDDRSYLLENENLLSLEGLRRIWLEPSSSPQYYPLVFTTFWVEQHLWGLEPFGYHLVNVLVHLTSSLLLWRLLAKLRVPGALFACALFLLHPLHVESVAWITERKNVLSMFFMLAALNAWFCFRPLDDDEGAARSLFARLTFYFLALLLLLAALCSKTVTACMPAAVLLILWWKRGRIGVRDLLPLLPMFLMGALLGLHTAHLEQTQVHASGPDWDFTFVERVLIAGRVPWFYLGKLLWPAPLIFFYVRWEIDSGLWWQYLFPVAALLLVVGLWALRRPIGRGPLTATLFFGGALLPASGFFNLYPQRFSFVADHFMYHAGLGPIVLFAALAATLFAAPHRRRLGMLLGGLLLLCLAGLTWRQGRVYENLETLWIDTIEKNPTCWAAYTNLGQLYREAGREEEALPLIYRGAELSPPFSEARIPAAAYRIQDGDIEGALRLYAPIFEQLPTFRIPREIADALYRQGRKAEAIQLLEGVIKMSPEYVEQRTTLGKMYRSEGEVGKARRQFERVLTIDPRNPDAHFGLGGIFAAAGNRERALQHYRRTLEVRPDYPKAREYLDRVLAMKQGGR
jgi:protein O-mannosyl-transferase